MADAGDRADIFDRLRLIRSESIGPATYWQLLRRFGTAAAALDAIPALASRGGGRAPVIASAAAVEKEMAAVARLGARYLFRGDPDYPPLLGEIDGAPAALIAKGDFGLLGRTAVAIVGARNASAAACRFARQLAGDLGAREIVVVSGLARGIDTAAHDGALESGTIAVIAGGIDIFYPPENEQRQRMIGERGLLIAEQPPGLEPRARHFPHRNRIIAGLAVGAVIVEAAPKSGSLITARQAADYGRDVMAVPGSPLDPRAQGCNQLIRDGATLIQNAADVIDTINPFGTRPVAEAESSYSVALPTFDAANVTDADRRTVSDLLNPTPVAVDEIIRQGRLPAALVQTILLELELAGRIERHAGGRVSLV